jgi:hypothetical protein
MLTATGHRSTDFITQDRTAIAERRAHQRLDLDLPLEFHLSHGPAEFGFSRTTNISTGGLCFEHTHDELTPGDTIDITLTVPASEGVWPYDARATCTARVLRTVRIPDRINHGPAIQHVAAQFTDRLRFQF